MNFSFFPTKNIEMSKSIFFVGAIIIKILRKKKKVIFNDLYQDYLKEAKKVGGKHLIKLEIFVLSLDYLFSINVIVCKEGEILYYEIS